LFVVLVRLVSYPAVFRGPDVVLSGNDPYYYRHFVEQVLRSPSVSVSTLPARAADGEPLLVASLSLVATLLGGTADVAGLVLAWYPVVSAALTALLIYVVAVRLTGDPRIALGAVAMLAVLPGHAMRTSLGFADHHAFDYVWVAVSLTGLTLLSIRARDSARLPRPLVGPVLLVAVGVTGSVLAWEAGPLMIVPIGLLVYAQTVQAVWQRDSPVVVGGATACGLVLAGGLTWSVHTTLQWHTALVASTPIVLAGAVVAVVGLAELWHRAALPWWGLALVDVVGALTGVVLLRLLQPAQWTRIWTALTERLLADRAIAEVQGLFSDSIGWLLLFGFLLFFALPYVGWVITRARTAPQWLPLVVYTGYFLLLSSVQVRFVGQLSLPLAVFAGLGFVHLVTRVVDTPSPAVFTDHPPGGDRPTVPVRLPSRQHLVAALALFVLISSLSIVQVPVKTSQLTVTDDQYETARAMDEYVDSHDHLVAETYVFSSWSRNRVYNYVVRGDAASYGYARANFDQFITATNATSWNSRLRGRAGFVVTTEAVVSNSSTLGTRLHEAHGSRTADASGLGHYRLISTTADGSHKAFAVVPGAVIQGTTQPNASVTVHTTVTVDSTTFQYTRETTATTNGSFAVRVAYPGAYRVGNQSVTVTDSAVHTGDTVSANA
jgi:dolichyl-diphosphooligosaccharide--protein glycosyltransferase